MKKILAALFVCLSLSQVCSGGGVGVYGTYWAPEGSDNDAYGVGARYRLDVLPFVSLQVGYTDYAQFEYSSLLDIDAQCGELAAMATLPIDRVSIYGGLGGAYYLLDAKGIGGTEVSLKDQTALFGFGGVLVRLFSFISAFADVRYSEVGAEIETDTKGTVETDSNALDGFSGTVGLAIEW